MEHPRHCTQATLTVQIGPGPRRLKPPCGFPVAPKIKSKILAMAHEALLRPAPGTSPCAPSSSKCSLRIEDLLPASTCPPGLRPWETPSPPRRAERPQPLPAAWAVLSCLPSQQGPHSEGVSLVLSFVSPAH